MSTEKQAQRLITMKVPPELHEVFKLMQKRYKMRLSDSILAFIEEHDKKLIETGAKIAEMKAEIEKLGGDFGDEEDEE